MRGYGKTAPVWVREFIVRYRDRMPPLSVREDGRYARLPRTGTLEIQNGQRSAAIGVDQTFPDKNQAVI
ncbi:MAG: hypothetical protein LBR87_03995 [Synergistaceae bacterium]|nr:hypothetical protein [Synergistaceae bacterium]